MSTMDMRTTLQLRRWFRYLNRFMLLLFRLGLGRWVNAWPEVGGRILILAHTGRKSHLRHYSGVNYALLNDELYLVSGFGARADWYLNLRAEPHVEVWLPDGWYAGLAEDITGCPEQTAFMRQVLIASGFAARVAGLNPRTLSDQALDQATRDYRLVHIHRIAERTGSGGPGSLAWVWPAATFLLLPLALRRRRK